MTSPEIILVGGPPWSGKSTVSKLVQASEFPLPIRHISMGDRLRAIGQGKIESKYSDVLMQNMDGLKKHTAMPTGAAIGVFEEFIEEDLNSLIVVDGFPRYPDRIDVFRESVERLGINVLGVCRIDVSDEVVIERSQLRAPRFEEAEKQQSFVQSRLDDYYRSVDPTLLQLEQYYDTYRIDGTQRSEVVASQIQHIINTKSNSI